MKLTPLALAMGLFAATCPSQVLGIDDLDPSTGGANAFPFNVTGGQTSLHVYSATTLRSLGLCAGAVLLDVAVPPSSTGAGTYNAPQAKMEIGHLAVSPPVAGSWTTHLSSPIVVHDLTSGPYTFNWTADTYVSLPGFATSAFVWDGVRDVGLLYTSSSGMTGGFTVHRTATQLRHYVAVFGATTQAPTSNGLFAMEVKMTWAPPPNCATKATYGAGCYDRAYTFYERFSGLPAFDFAGAPAAEQVITGVSFPSGFFVTNGASAWSAPTSTQVLSNAATPAPMGDDTISQPLLLPFSFPFPGGSTSVIHAAANGYVMLAATSSNAADATPTAAELVAQGARLCPLWCDIEPTANTATNPASGIYFDIAPGNQSVTVTWLDCGDGRGGTPAGGTTSINVQCVLHANGDFEYRYGTILPSAGVGEAIVGWSQGNAFGQAARNPGSVDLSATMPFATSGPDATALSLDSTYPQIGSNFVLTTSDVPNLIPLAFVFFGDTQIPGFDMTSLGAPGCSLYTNGNLLSLTHGVVAGTGSVTIAVPNTPTLFGVTVTTQSVAFTLLNALNLATSNGLSWTVGN